MSWILQVLIEAWDLFFLAAPFILFGLLVAGVLQVLLSTRGVLRWTGQPGLSSVFRAALLGIPLPLCSCGVLPTAIGLHRKGASRPALASFLITTPETSTGSVMLTWALLGPLMAILRPLAAFATGVLAGVFSMAQKPQEQAAPRAERQDAQVPEPHGGDIEKGRDYVGPQVFWMALKAWVRSLFVDSRKESAPAADREETSFPQILQSIGRYAFTRALDDIAFYLVLGLLMAGLLTVILPADLTGTALGSGFLTMLIVLLIAIPMYTCSSGTTPVAAALVAKGMSPGTALVLLLAGPAVSMVSILVATKHFGRRFLKVYVGSVVLATLAWGLGLDLFLKATGTTIIPEISPPSTGFVALLNYACAFFLLGLIVWRLWFG
ncbi:MAG: SO_0444 family Cu/Zn efflux transporter, partial [Candidatus Eisenbacteria bacterium]|nr:SO_0444 family Cu/Zn efflux transporter [Candidatus Eisenbacteria bacterium]